MWKDVQREPVIREYNPQDETPALIADFFVVEFMLDREERLLVFVSLTPTPSPIRTEAP